MQGESTVSTTEPPRRPQRHPAAPAPARRRLVPVLLIAGALILLLAGGAVLYFRPAPPEGFGGDLKTLLLPVPANGQAYTNADNPDGYLTLDEVVAEYYDGDAKVRGQLEDRDFRRGVEQEWSVGDSPRISVALLQCDHPDAASQLLGLNAGAYRGNPTFTDASATVPVGSHLFTGKDADRPGYTTTAGFAVKGTIIVVVFVWEVSPSTGAVGADVLAKQLALLP